MNVDLSTTFLGLRLDCPLVASAGPLTANRDNLRRLEDAGAGAAVLPSLFEEQIQREEMAVHWLHEFQTDSFAESLSYFPEMESYNTGPDSYLTLIQEAKQSLSMPVIGSLNGVSSGGWVSYARMIQQAGADALELNIYFLPTRAEQTGQELEEQYLELVAQVRSCLTIPLAVKTGPYFSALPNMARRLVQAGADGLVLFNRFPHPNVDLETLSVRPHLELSHPYELLMRLRWTAVLRNQLTASLAITGGVHTAHDAVKALLVGADAAMMTTILLKHGPDRLRVIREGLYAWLEENDYQSVAQLKGSMSLENCPDPTAFERANYMKALTSYTGPFI